MVADMTSLTNEQAFAELYFSKKAIKEVLGITVRCWRPPYGDTDDRIRAIAAALDMRTIMSVPPSPSLPGSNSADATRAQLERRHGRLQLGHAGHARDPQELPEHPEQPECGRVRRVGRDRLDARDVRFPSNSARFEDAADGDDGDSDAGTMELSQEFLPQIIKQFTGGVLPVAVCMKCVSPPLARSPSLLETDRVLCGAQQHGALRRARRLCLPQLRAVGSRHAIRLARRPNRRAQLGPAHPRRRARVERDRRGTDGPGAGAAPVGERVVGAHHDRDHDQRCTPSCGPRRARRTRRRSRRGPCRAVNRPLSHTLARLLDVGGDTRHGWTRPAASCSFGTLIPFSLSPRPPRPAPMLSDLSPPP